MKKILSVVLIIAFALPSYAVVGIDSIPLDNKINPEVQVQNNGWLKIINIFTNEYTPKEYYEHHSSLYEDDKSKLEEAIKKNAGKKYRILYVNIQFLKPCKATTLRFGVDEREIKNPLLADLDMGAMETDFLMPKFRCDYRVNVFFTLYDKNGNEIVILKKRPLALRYGSTWTRKTEMLPGETMQMRSDFSIDSSKAEVAGWNVWLPK